MGPDFRVPWPYSCAAKVCPRLARSFLKFLSEGLEQNEDKTIAAVPPVQIKIEDRISTWD